MFRRVGFSLGISLFIHMAILFPMYTDAENDIESRNVAHMKIHMRVEPPTKNIPEQVSQQFALKQFTAEPISAGALMNQPKTKIIFNAYFNDVRERIRKSSSVYESQALGKAVVPVSFIIKRNGSLSEAGSLIRLGSEELSALAERIVRTSAPFKPIPDGIEYDEVSFLINIEFSPTN